MNFGNNASALPRSMALQVSSSSTLLFSNPVVSAWITTSGTYGKSLPNRTCEVDTNSRSAEHELRRRQRGVVVQPLELSHRVPRRTVA